MNRSDQINELALALAKAQGEIENADKNKQNPHLKSKYADLGEILNTVRPVLSVYGLSFMQMPTFDNGVVSVETILMHSSGQFVSNTCSCPVSKQDAQGIGAVITYLRRYSLAAFVGISQEDDDGGSGKPPQQQPIQPQQKPTLDDAKFNAAVEKSKGNPANKQKLLNNYDLTEDQYRVAIAL